MPESSLTALVIFALVYTIIVLGESSPRKLDRPAAGLIGGVLMFLGGVLTRQECLAAVDFPTLILLFGMMVLVHYATVSGLLDRMAHWVLHFSKSATQLLWMVCFSAGILSALFVNDTICLLMTPLVLSAARRANLPREPYLICLATSSNVGSVMTITGNPQNMLIGQASGFSWAGFAAHMLPIGLICLVVNGLLVFAIYKRDLHEVPVSVEGIAEKQPLDRKLAIKTMCVLIALLVAFLVGVPMEVAALTAAVFMIVLANRQPSETFDGVDWGLLLFFTGLFIVVEGITKTQGLVLNQLMPFFIEHAHGIQGLTIFSAASVTGSNLFSNVPFVMLLRKSMALAPNAPLLWLMLAASSTFAGNLTLVGSVANLIVAQCAKDECELSFVSFLKVGVLTTLATVVIAIAVLYLYELCKWV